MKLAILTIRPDPSGVAARVEGVFVLRSSSSSSPVRWSTFQHPLKGEDFALLILVSVNFEVRVSIAKEGERW